MKKTQKYSNFCFCLGLRPGVIISSILWMVEGLSFSIILFTDRKVDEKEEIEPIYHYFDSLLLKILSSHFIILTLISIFGLVSLLIPKSTPLLRIYSHISWFFAVFIHLVLTIVSITAVIVIRGDVIKKYCIGETGDEYDECVNHFSPLVNSQLLWMSLCLFFQGSLHVYFSIILRAYVAHCEQVGKKQKRKSGSSKRLNLLNSSNISSNYNVFNIKVDKTFDDRTVDNPY